MQCLTSGSLYESQPLQQAGNPFGQPMLGTPTNTAFGLTSSSIFGPQQQPGSLFGQSNKPTLGTPTTSAGFTSGSIFGPQPQQPAVSPWPKGQANKPTLGTSTTSAFGLPVQTPFG
jgi:hypothetical protein